MMESLDNVWQRLAQWCDEKKETLVVIGIIGSLLLLGFVAGALIF